MADTERSQAAQEIEAAAKAAGNPATFGLSSDITLKIWNGEVTLTENTQLGGFRVDKIKAPDGREAERLGRFQLHGLMTALDVVGNLREQEGGRMERERLEAQRLEGARSAAPQEPVTKRTPAPTVASHGHHAGHHATKKDRDDS